MVTAVIHSLLSTQTMKMDDILYTPRIIGKLIFNIFSLNLSQVNYLINILSIYSEGQAYLCLIMRQRSENVLEFKIGK